MKAIEWSQHYSQYKSMGIFQTLKGNELRSPWSGLTEFRTPPRSYGYSLSCKNEEGLIKNEGARVVTRFSQNYNPVGDICCHGNQSSQSPMQLMMLQIKFDYDYACLVVDKDPVTVDYPYSCVETRFS